MTQDTRKERAMQDGRQPARLVVLAVLLLVTMGSVVPLSAAADQTKTVKPPVTRTLAKLAGNWVATIVGNTGCGLGTMYVTFTLNSSGGGNGTATIVTHAQCGDSTTTGLDFNITSLNPDGSGTAGLSCGAGCGWDLKIQVTRSSTAFNLVDVGPENPNNYIAGAAILQ